VSGRGSIPEDENEPLARIYAEHPEIIGTPDELMFVKLYGWAAPRNRRIMRAARNLATVRRAALTGAAPVRHGKAGHPPWTLAVFWEHWRKATAEAKDQRPATLAATFRALDGTIGVAPETLRRLTRRFGLPPE